MKMPLHSLPTLYMTAHAVFRQWTGFVEVEDLVQAEGLTTSGSEWAELMTWALAFAATSHTVSVPESEPERAKLNTWCRRFRDLKASRGGPGDQGLVTDQDTTDSGSPKNVDAEAAAATVKQVPDDTVSLDESLSPAEQAATAAEVFSLSSAEQADQAYAALLKLAALSFDSMDGISQGPGSGIRTLDQAMRAVESGPDGTVADPIFGKRAPSFDDLRTVIAPTMRKVGGSYRANQVRLLGADTPAAVYDLVKQRRDECFSCLSPGYMASRLYFVKQWVWFCLEVAEVSPMRKWTGSCDDFEDGLLEAFLLTCSCRFVTWGSPPESIHRSLVHSKRLENGTFRDSVASLDPVRSSQSLMQS